MGDEERCEYCDLMKQKKNLLFEDGNVYVMHSPTPATIGHLLVLPKKHFLIIEQVPDYLVGELFKAANKASTEIIPVAVAPDAKQLTMNEAYSE